MRRGPTHRFSPAAGDVEDEDPAAVPQPLDVLVDAIRRLEQLHPDDAARVATTLATWFGGEPGGAEPDDDEDG